MSVSGLADWIQDDLFGETETDEESGGEGGALASFDAGHVRHRWPPGADVVHHEHGRGWVWGSGLGRVTVRFETADTPPGPVLTFRADDPDLSLVTPD